MANYAVWNVRKRHESLSKPRKAKHLNKRTRERCGLEEALDRKREDQSEEQPAAAEG